MTQDRLRVVIGWHMHQPEYRDPSTGVSQLPWTYLHAIKDYVDMAAHLEATPLAKSVVNFAPLLLEQLQDRAATIRGHLESGAPLLEPLLEALVASRYSADPEARAKLIELCLKANRARLIDPFPAYAQLAQIADLLKANPKDARLVSDAYLADIVTWYHLAWMGETVRRDNALVKSLIEQGRGFSLAQRRKLLQLIGELVASIIPRYRALADSGHVELTVTPYGHPIVPLLVDLNSAHEAMPGAPLPQSPAYPGGADRARWHLQRALEVFETAFGRKPQGCWLSEGGVSEAALDLLHEAGLRWTATGQNVLENSARSRGIEPTPLCLPIHVGNHPTLCFFRDDELSDAVGFQYQTWHADDAVSDLIRRLESKAEHHGPDAVVLIYLDGENAWEYYPMNGYWLLSTLYRRLAEHPRLRLTTMSDVLAEGVVPSPIPHLMAGSWVYGTFSTWIGSADKNRGWDLLVPAKQAYDRAIAKRKFKAEERQAIDRQLAVCEGSDWFWWLGDYNPEGAVSDFESLFRLHLRRLYEMLSEPVPEQLGAIISRGQGAPATGGTMRAAKA